ncbi:hypothetical protein [Nocardia sp. FBN12]|uniref:hypothetical protein n=1 Tax=Nocardia sp. FBN12 TaxID=3419766 RepID=UPI003D035C32
MLREHPHSGDHHAIEAADSSIAVLADFFLSTVTAAHCDADGVHCVAKAIPPGVSLTPAALLLAVVSAVTLISPTQPAGGVGVRGPPGRRPSTRGRSILSLHCIARR